MIKQPVKANVSATVKIPALNPPAAGCFIFIPNLRAYPSTLRGTAEWDSTYKIRVNVEKSINHFKDSFCVARRKTQNEKTLHADRLLAGITQLITVMMADKLHRHQYIRSLKPLIA